MQKEDLKNNYKRVTRFLPKLIDYDAYQYKRLAIPFRELMILKDDAKQYLQKDDAEFDYLDAFYKEVYEESKLSDKYGYSKYKLKKEYK